MIKTARPFLPDNRQGIAIDLLIASLNLFLFPLFNSRVGNLFNASFGNDSGAFKTLGWLMFLILGCRLGGLYLKRFPLRARLRKNDGTSFALAFFILNVPVFLLTVAFVMVLLTGVLGGAGLTETRSDGSPQDSQTLSLFGVFIIVILLILEIYFLYRLSVPLEPREKRMLAGGNWRFGWKGETLADFGLFAYMSVWQVFYNQTAEIFLTFPPNVRATLGMKIISLIFLLVCFLMFYLAPRAVFLIEDRKYLGTWLFILLVFLSSIVRYW